MTVDVSPGLEGSTFVAPKKGASGFGGRPMGPAAPSPATSRAVNGVASAVEAVGQAELKAIETVDDVAKGEWGMPEITDSRPAQAVVPVPVEGGPGSSPAGASAPAPIEGRAVPPGPSSETGAAGHRTDTSPENKVDPFPDKTPEKRGAMAVATAKDKIKEKLDTGGYDAEAKQKAEAALSYDGSKPASETSASLKSLLDVVREARGPNQTRGEYYSDLYDELSRNAVVIVGADVLTLSEFEKARQDAVLAGDQARVDQLDKGVYGFRFEESPEVKQQKAIDQTLGSEIDSLKRQIAERKASKQETKTYEEILRGLEIAQTVEGDGRALFALTALRHLRASGLSQEPVNLGEAIDGSGELEAKSVAAIKRQAADLGYTLEEAEFIVNKIRKGELADLHKIGFFSKPGVDKLIFGKELDDKEMAERLALVLPGEAGRKFGKDEGLMILLMALVGVTQATRQAVMGEFRK